MSRWARAVALAVAVLLLGGCFRFDLTGSLSSRGTMSGTLVVAVSEQVLAMSGETAGDMVTESELGFRASIKPYSENGLVGQTVTFDSVPTDQLASLGLSITHTRDHTFVLDGQFPPPTEQGESATGGTVRLAITFPGDVLSSNGTVEGHTVRWSSDGTLTVHAESKDSTGWLHDPWTLALLGVGALAVVALVALVTILLVGRGSRRAQPPQSWRGSGPIPGYPGPAAPTPPPPA